MRGIKETSRNKLVNYSKIVEVIEVSVLEGSGTREDVSRTVTYYYSKDGKLLVRIDEWEQRGGETHDEEAKI